MEKCLFCGIIAGNVQAEVVYEDEHLIAFKDINPQAPVHLLIVPRKHISTLMDLGEEDGQLIGRIFLVAQKLAVREGLGEKGFRVIANCKADAGQAVFHIHFHLLGGRKMGWPPG